MNIVMCHDQISPTHAHRYVHMAVAMPILITLLPPLSVQERTAALHVEAELC
jgi:hypothetical protein